MDGSGLDLQTLLTYSPTGGYFDADKFRAPEGTMADGSFNVLVQAGGTRIFKGLKAHGDGARQLSKIFGGYAGLIDNEETEGNGSVFNFIANSLFWIGEGKLTYNGTQLTDDDTLEDFIATSNLQLSPSPYDNAFTAGLAEPDAPIVEARTPTLSDPSTGLMNGLYSFKVARVRSVTGGRSIASITSAVILFTGQTARLTFPLLDSNGQDRWAVFSTKAGFGGTGVHYLVQEIADDDLVTIDGVERSYEFNVVDADLLPVIAYIDDYPPPAGSYGGRIENYVVVVGAYDNAIAISIRNFPESFNPDHLAFLPKAPTAVLQDQMGSYLYISCADSVHALSVAPSAYGNPMIMQTIWTDTGVAHNHNWCSVEGVLFAFVSRQGAVTMDQQGHPSAEFAVPVAKKMRDWDVGDVVVAHVPDLNSVMFANGDEAYLFHLSEMKWSSPTELEAFADGSIISAVVQDRRLLVTMNDGDDFNLYEFDEPPTDGDGTTFAVVSPDVKPNPLGRINVTNLRSTFQAPNTGDFTFNVVTDHSVTKTLTHTVTNAGMQETKLFREGILTFRNNAIHVEWNGTQEDFDEDCYLSLIEVFGTVEESSVL